MSFKAWQEDFVLECQNTMDTAFVMEALMQAMMRYGLPELAMFNIVSQNAAPFLALDKYTEANFDDSAKTAYSPIDTLLALLTLISALRYFYCSVSVNQYGFWWVP